MLRRLSSQYDLAQVTLLCSRLTFIDVAGLRALLTALRRFGDGGPPRLLDAPPIVTTVIEMTGADAFFDTGDRRASPDLERLRRRTTSSAQ